jgi:hypothetical protein
VQGATLRVLPAQEEGQLPEDLRLVRAATAVAAVACAAALVVARAAAALVIAHAAALVVARAAAALVVARAAALAAAGPHPLHLGVRLVLRRPRQRGFRG